MECEAEPTKVGRRKDLATVDGGTATSPSSSGLHGQLDVVRLPQTLGETSDNDDRRARTNSWKKQCRRKRWRERVRRDCRRRKDWVVEEFGRMIGELTSADLEWLLRFRELEAKVSVWSAADRAVFDCSGEVPWFVVWLLGRFHRKHIFYSRSRMQAGHVHREVRRVVDRIKWRWLYRHSNEPVLQRMPRITSVPCTAVVDGALQAWLARLQSCILADAAKAQSASCRQPRPDPISRLAWRWLRANPWEAVPADKEAGFVLHAREDLVQVHASILGDTAVYKEVHPSDVRAEARISQYCRLVSRIAKFEGNPSWSSVLNRSLRWGKRIAVQLSTTCKTHKSPGKVGHRNIHAGRGWPFYGIGKYVANEIGRALAPHTHLLQSVDQLPAVLAQVQLPDADVYMIQADVDHFLCLANLPSLWETP